jgi:tetratricopeptide (TPR) repeat protein
MSILDGMFSKDAADCANLLLKPVSDIVAANMSLTSQQKKALEAVEKGVPLAAVLNIDRKQRDAMFIRGCDLFKAGQFEPARDLLTLLLALQPTDARVIYALALTYQVVGEIEAAAKLLIFFIALDATNPDGHLRLGECLLAAKEYEEAGACFRTAARLCANGHGTQSSREHAARMVHHMEALSRITAH